MLATAGSLACLGDETGWAFEMKWDGVRALVHARSGRVRLVSRNALDMAVSYPEIAVLGEALPGPVVLDGEIVSLDEAGRPSFRRLQKRMHVSGAATASRLARSDPALLLLFDVLYLDGTSLLQEPWVRRRERLESLALAGPGWQTPPVFIGTGSAAVAVSREQALEGVMAKRLGSPYTPGRRSPDWVKMKNVRTQEVVIGGWTPGRGRRDGMIGALLLGLPDPSGMTYAGKVGTGFTDAALRDLAACLGPLETTSCPFIAIARPDAAQARWVEPALVGEVEFTEWTQDGRLRHPTWRGLRPDKSADQVVRES
jgi:bifunctional non-homologous end joining protein LigD